MNLLALIVGYACALTASGTTLFFAMSNAGVMARPFYRRYAIYLLGICGFMTLAPVIQFLGRTHPERVPWLLLGLNLSIMACFGWAVKHYHPGLLPGGQSRRTWGTWFVLGTLTNAVFISMVFLWASLRVGFNLGDAGSFTASNQYGPILVLLGWILLYVDCKRQKVIVTQPVWTILTLTGYLFSICGIIWSLVPSLPTSLTLLQGSQPAGLSLFPILVGILGLFLGLVQFAWLTQVWASLGTLVMMVICLVGLYHFGLVQWGFPYLGMAGAPVLYFPLLAIMDRFTQLARKLDWKRQRNDHERMPVSLGQGLKSETKPLSLSRTLTTVTGTLGVALGLLAATEPISLVANVSLEAGIFLKPGYGFLVSGILYSIYLLLTWWFYQQPLRAYLGIGILFLLLLLGKPSLESEDSSLGTTLLSGISLALVFLAPKGSRWHDSHKSMQIGMDMGLIGCILGVFLIGFRIIHSFGTELWKGSFSQNFILANTFDSIALIVFSITLLQSFLYYKSLFHIFLFTSSLALIFSPNFGLLAVLIAFLCEILKRSDFINYFYKFKIKHGFFGNFILTYTRDVSEITLLYTLEKFILPICFIGFTIDSLILIFFPHPFFSYLSLILSLIIVYTKTINSQSYFLVISCIIFFQISIITIPYSLLNIFINTENNFQAISFFIFCLFQLPIFELLFTIRLLTNNTQKTSLNCDNSYCIINIVKLVCQGCGWIGLIGVVYFSIFLSSTGFPFLVPLSGSLMGIFHAWISFRSRPLVFSHSSLFLFTLSIGLFLIEWDIPAWWIGNIVSSLFMVAMYGLILGNKFSNGNESNFPRSAWFLATIHLALVISFLNVVSTLWNGLVVDHSTFPPESLIVGLGMFGLVCLSATWHWRAWQLLLTGLAVLVLASHGLYQRLLVFIIPENSWIFQSPHESPYRIFHLEYALVWIVGFLGMGCWILSWKSAHTAPRTEAFPITMSRISWLEFLAIGFIRMGWVGTLLGLTIQVGYLLFVQNQNLFFGREPNPNPGYSTLMDALLSLGFGCCLFLIAFLGKDRYLLGAAPTSLLLSLSYLGSTILPYPFGFEGAIHITAFLGLILALLARLSPLMYWLHFPHIVTPAFRIAHGNCAYPKARPTIRSPLFLISWAFVFLLASIALSLHHQKMVPFQYKTIVPFQLVPVFILTSAGFILLMGTRHHSARWILGITGVTLGYTAILGSICWLFPSFFYINDRLFLSVLLLYTILNYFLTFISVSIFVLFQYFYKCLNISYFFSSQKPNIQLLVICYNYTIFIISTVSFFLLVILFFCVRLIESMPIEEPYSEALSYLWDLTQSSRLLGWNALVLAVVLFIHAQVFSSGLPLNLGLICLGLGIECLLGFPTLGPAWLGCFGLFMCLVANIRFEFLPRHGFFPLCRFFPWSGKLESLRFPLETRAITWKCWVSFTGLELVLFSILGAIQPSIRNWELSVSDRMAALGQENWLNLAVCLQCLAWGLMTQYRIVPGWGWIVGTSIALVLESYPLVALLHGFIGKKTTPDLLLESGPFMVCLALSMVFICPFFMKNINYCNENNEQFSINMTWIFSIVVATLGWFHSLGYMVLYGSESRIPGFLNLACMIVPLMMLPRIVGSMGQSVSMIVRYEYLVAAIMAPWVSGLLILRSWIGIESIGPFTLGYSLFCGILGLALGKPNTPRNRENESILDDDFPTRSNWNWQYLGKVLLLPTIGLSCFLPWAAFAWQLSQDRTKAENLSSILELALLPVAIESFNLVLFSIIYKNKNIFSLSLWMVNFTFVSFCGGFLNLNIQSTSLLFLIILHFSLFLRNFKKFTINGTYISKGFIFWVDSTATVLLVIELISLAFKALPTEFAFSNPLLNLLPSLALVLVFARSWARESSHLWFHGLTLGIVHLFMSILLVFGTIPSLPLAAALYSWIWITLVSWNQPEEAFRPLIPGWSPEPKKPANQHTNGEIQTKEFSNIGWSRAFVAIAFGILLFLFPLELRKPGSITLCLAILTLAWLTHWVFARILIGKRYAQIGDEKSSLQLEIPLQNLGTPTHQTDWGWLFGVFTALSLYWEIPSLLTDHSNIRWWLANLPLPLILICLFAYRALAWSAPVPAMDRVIIRRMIYGSLVLAAISLCQHFLGIPTEQDPTYSLIWVLVSTAWIFVASLRHSIHLFLYIGYLGCCLTWIISAHRLHLLPSEAQSKDATALLIGCFGLLGISLAMDSIKAAWSSLLGQSAFRFSIFLPSALVFVFPKDFSAQILLFLALGSFYLFLHTQTGIRWFLYLSLGFINAGIYWAMPLIYAATTLSQLYVVPAAITLLIITQIHRREFPQKAVAGIRYGASTAILASSTGEFYFSQQAALEHFVMVLFASLAVIGVGIALKIRPFLFLGFGFLLVNVLGQLGSKLLLENQGVIRAGILIVLGLIILGIMMFFNSRRSLFVTHYRSFMDRSNWE